MKHDWLSNRRSNRTEPHLLVPRPRNPLLLVVLAAALVVETAHAEKTSESLGEFGVALAMAGESARAESIFVSMLSNTRGDARALNNLGNLRVLRGDFGVALAFYDRALRGDSTDAGIRLNRATALMLMGDDARAQEAAAGAIRVAGGVDRAQEVLGLKAEKKEPAKAAEKAFVSKDEVRALLLRAATAVPKDTAKAVPAASAKAGKQKTPTWRSAGPRSAERSDIAEVLYWKR